MAIVLGSKLVKDTEKYNDWAIGVVLPIQIGNTGFNQSYTTAVQTKSNIKNLLLTKKYERLMQPNLGSDLQKVLFEMNDDSLEEKIENELKDANQVNVSLKFRIDNSVNLETLSFNVQA
jgi:hypothetical protein